MYSWKTKELLLKKQIIEFTITKTQRDIKVSNNKNQIIKIFNKQIETPLDLFINKISYQCRIYIQARW